MNSCIFSLCASVLIFTADIHAQTDTSAQYKSPFAKGTKALLFQISNNFTLRSFEGGLISFKRHFSEKNAIRIGVSFSGHHDEDEYKRVSNPPDSMNYRNKSIESFVSTSVYGTFIRYIIQKRTIKSYFGIGLSAGYDHRFHSNDGYDPGMNTWIFGPLGVFGVEWFPHSSISFSAEYNFAGNIYFGKGYTSFSEDSSGKIYKNRTKTFGYGFGQQNVRFGLSVYL